MGSRRRELVGKGGENKEDRVERWVEFKVQVCGYLEQKEILIWQSPNPQRIRGEVQWAQARRWKLLFEAV